MEDAPELEAATERAIEEGEAERRVVEPAGLRLSPSRSQSRCLPGIGTSAIPIGSPLIAGTQRLAEARDLAEASHLVVEIAPAIEMPRDERPAGAAIGAIRLGFVAGRSQ